MGKLIALRLADSENELHSQVSELGDWKIGKIGKRKCLQRLIIASFSDIVVIDKHARQCDTATGHSSNNWQVNIASKIIGWWIR